MAIAGKIISNPISGQQVRFIQTARDTEGSLLEMESRFAPHSREPAGHYHPYQEENFVVLQGCINLRLDGTVHTYSSGSVIDIKAGAVHSMWNEGDVEALVNWKIFPAMNTEYLLETGMGLAKDGKINNKGLPDVLQAALMMRKYSSVYRLAKPSQLIQKIMFTLLAPVAVACGYRSVYSGYID